MTIVKTTQSLAIGVLRTDNKNLVYLENCYCIPVWRDETISWFDCYSSTTGLYLGRKETFEECTELDNGLKHR